VKLVKEKEKLDLAGRIGVVLHWLGSALGFLLVLVAVWAFIDISIKYDLASGAVEAAIFLGAGLCAWIVGLVARYLLKEDLPRYWP
jgi:hypothetical protein